MSSFNQRLNSKSQFIIAIKVAKASAPEGYASGETQEFITSILPFLSQPLYYRVIL